MIRNGWKVSIFDTMPKSERSIVAGKEGAQQTSAFT